jgi:enoyl-CoA hydratase/carnithine racemase
MAILEFGKEDSVAVIRMNSGKNVQNLSFAQAMDEMIDQVIEDQSIKSLVIASTDVKNWSQGLDLEWISQERGVNEGADVKKFFLTLDQIYSKLMLLPVPAIAAINGHAFGAGAFLATACDYRLMNSHRGFFCFPEIDLKMDFLPGVFSMLVHKIPPFKFPDLIYTGKHATATELERFFIVEKACDGVEETLVQSMIFARGFDKDRELFGIYKNKINGNAARTLVEKNMAHFTGAG